MAWRLREVEHEVFPRNPLELVVIELRYSPILKINERQTDLQDSLRHRFPEIADRVEAHFVWSVEHGPSVSQRLTRTFVRPTDQTEVVIGESHAALTCRKHHSRATLTADFIAVVDALRDVVGPLHPTRLGVRYVNRLLPHMAEGSPDPFAALLQGATWPSLPGQGAGETLRFAVEVDDALEPGRLTVRHAREPMGDHRVTHRLDMDRYVDDPPPDALHDTLASFGDDLWRAFSNHAGPSLIRWMREEA